MEVVPGAGHFTWLGAPKRFWSVVSAFVRGFPG